MNYRCSEVMRVLAISMVLVVSASVPVAAQATKSASTGKSWAPPRTPDGKPDLQGVWNSAILTPFERPKEFAGKEFFTPREAEEFTKAELYRVDGDRRDGGGNADVGRAYNEFWRDRGSSRRTYEPR